MTNDANTQHDESHGFPLAFGPAAQARAYVYVFAGASTIALLLLAIPHAGREDKTALIALAGVGYLVAAVIGLLGRRMNLLAYHAVGLVATTIITLAIYFSHSDSSAYAAFYIWVGIYGFYFFAPLHAAIQLGALAAAYAALLAFGEPTSAPAARWITTVGTVLVAGTLIARLVALVRERAAEAAGRAQSLREAEAHTRSIIDTANEAFVAMDAEGLIIDWNPCAEATFGWPASDVVGRSVAEILVPERHRALFSEQVAELVASVDADQAGQRFESPALHRDGHEMPVEVTVAPMRRGDSWMFIAFVHDISERRNAERQIRARAENVARVARVARDLSGVTEAHAARPAIATAACELTDSDVAILFEPGAHGRELLSTAVAGLPVPPIHLPFSGEPSGAAVAFSSGEPFFVADLADHAAVSKRIVDELGMRSALWQPIARNSVSIGVLAVAWRERVETLPDGTRALMGLLAAEASVALERADLLARLEAVARTDDLTGLANRRAWDEELPRELARARRESRPLCVAMLDLDRFKQFNDENGHQAGDRLLKEVTATWKETLRPSDVLARYGGEEFVLLLPSCPIELGLEVVDRLRTQTPTTQTCSAGVAVWDGEENPEQLVARADAALYQAKEAGRDQSVAAP